MVTAAGPYSRPAQRIRPRHVVAATVRGRPAHRRIRLLADPHGHDDVVRHGFHPSAERLDPAVVAELLEAAHRWLEAIEPLDGTFRSSFELQDSEAGMQARRDIRRLLLPALRAQVVPDAQLRPTVFQCKPPGALSGVQAHQDPFLTDERRSYGLSAWVALTPVGVDDGPMVVLPGSHRYGSWSRASTPGDPLAHLQPAIARHGRAVALEPGQVLWFDQATIHGSLPNVGPGVRIGVSAVATPAGTEASFSLARPDDLDTIDVLQRPGGAGPGDDSRSLGEARPVATLGRDRLEFGGRSLTVAVRLHRALHGPPPGVALDLPEGTHLHLLADPG